MNEQKAIDWSIVFDDYFYEMGKQTIDKAVFDNICKSINEGHNGCVTYALRPATANFLKSEGFKIEEDKDAQGKYWMVSWQNDVFL